MQAGLLFGASTPNPKLQGKHQAEPVVVVTVAWGVVVAISNAAVLSVVVPATTAQHTVTTLRLHLFPLFTSFLLFLISPFLAFFCSTSLPATLRFAAARSSQERSFTLFFFNAPLFF